MRSSNTAATPTLTCAPCCHRFNLIIDSYPSAPHSFTSMSVILKYFFTPMSVAHAFRACAHSSCVSRVCTAGSPRRSLRALASSFNPAAGWVRVSDTGLIIAQENKKLHSISHPVVFKLNVFANQSFQEELFTRRSTEKAPTADRIAVLAIAYHTVGVENVHCFRCSCWQVTFR